MKHNFKNIQGVPTIVFSSKCSVWGIGKSRRYKWSYNIFIRLFNSTPLHVDVFVSVHQPEEYTSPPPIMKEFDQQI